MLLVLLGLCAAAAEPAWVTQAGAWGDARIVDVDVVGEAVWVLTERGLYVDGVLRAVPVDASVSMSAGRVFRTLPDGVCEWADEQWQCVPVDGAYPAAMQPGWLGGLSGSLWRERAEGWERLRSPLLPEEMERHVMHLGRMGDALVVVPQSGDWLVVDGDVLVRMPRPPVDRDAKRGEGPCGPELAVLDGLWAWRGGEWQRVEGGEAAVACSGDQVALVGGRMARWDGRALKSVPSGNGRPVLGFADPDLAYTATGLLRRVERAVVYRDDAPMLGIADPAPTERGWFVDLSGNGWPDLLTYSVAGQRWYVNTEGRFRARPLPPALAASGWTRPVVAGCDVDGDGGPDLLVAHSGKLHLWLTGVDGLREVTQRGVDDASAVGVLDLDCVDLDGDGDLDVFGTAIHGDEDTQPLMNAVWENEGFGILRRTRPARWGLAGSQGWEFASGFSEDGSVRAVATAWTEQLHLQRRLADGRWVADKPLHAGSLQGREVALADLDGDAALDVVLAQERGLAVFSDALGAARRVPQPTLPSPHPAPADFTSMGMALDDVDRDGDLDLLTTGERGATVYLNDGIGRFHPVASTGLEAATALRLAFADVDRDGDVDVFSPQAGAGDRLLVHAHEGERLPPMRLEPEGWAHWLGRRLAWVRWGEGGLRLGVAALWILGLAVWGRRRGATVVGHPVSLLLAGVGAACLELAVQETASRWMPGVVCLASWGAVAVADVRLGALLRATRIAGYRVLGPLGSGGMATVHLVAEGRRRLALKVMHPDLADDAQARERFRREAELASRFDHPNLVRVEAAGECIVYTDDKPQRTLYLAMEFVPGTTLRARLRGPLPPGQACRVAVDLLAAVQALHEGEVVHRDIKPDNVLVHDDGLKLADFGIAQGQVSKVLTRTGHVLGTLAYMAPEQARGAATDHRADLYAVAVVLYEMLSGRPAFSAEDGLALVYQVLNLRPEPLEDVDPALVAVVERGMAAAPEDRFSSAQAMREALLPFADLEMMLRSWPGATQPALAGGADTQTVGSTVAGTDEVTRA